jgi:hypothetical protein
MILADSLPGFKRFLRDAHLSEAAYGHTLALVTTFLLHIGPMSATQASRCQRQRTRHLASLTRFLGQLGLTRNLLECARGAVLLLERERDRPGTWVFVLDATKRHSQTKNPHNAYCSANKKKRPRQSNRKQLKYQPRWTHTFVFGLLLTPGGLRLPYYTKDYAAAIERPFRTEAELGAELVRQVEVPRDATVVVLGDTAYEAEGVRQACDERGFLWVMPVNPERVFAGKKPRRKVHALPEELSERCFQPYRLNLSDDDHAGQRRLSAGRGGPGTPAWRTYWVHRRIADVHSVGEVVLLFSKKHQPKAGEKVAVDKVLMSNALSAGAAQLLAWYGLRWQVELFFKECKSVLGLDQYKLGQFVRVEGWVELCAVAFAYLEWSRARQLRRGDLDAKSRQDWQRARTWRLCQLLRQRLEEEEVDRMYRWVQTQSGRRRLKQILRRAYHSRSPPQKVA